MANFTHEPRAPEASTDPAHTAQRYFSGSDGERWIAGTVRVMRFADDTSAHVDVCTAYGKSRAEVTAYLTAAELREFASRLLDAAHDIEMHPADSAAIPA
jgi:hypothetical protein